MHLDNTDTEQNTTTICSTEQDTENREQNYSTYSYDIYHEYVAIKNSDTIEIYTILK